jgi:hypothetical protein
MWVRKIPVTTVAVPGFSADLNPWQEIDMNCAIGLLRDDPKVIRSAIRYLKRRQTATEVLF